MSEEFEDVYITDCFRLARGESLNADARQQFNEAVEGLGLPDAEVVDDLEIAKEYLETEGNQ
jgi:hypothetical protein